MEKYSREDIWLVIEAVIDDLESIGIKPTEKEVRNITSLVLQKMECEIDFDTKDYYKMIEILTKDEKGIINEGGEPRTTNKRGRKPKSKGE